MGIYYTANAILGFKIDLSNMYETETVRSCNHETGSAKFCPQCGERVKTSTEKTRSDLYDAITEKFWEGDLPNGIVWEIDEHKDQLYVGYGVSADRDEVKSCVIPSQEVITAFVAECFADVEGFVPDLSNFKLYVTCIGR